MGFATDAVASCLSGHRTLKSHYTYRNTYGAPLPVDIFNVHAFILREEQDNWGVGIPPGMDGWTGTLYELEDHDTWPFSTEHH